MKKKKDSICWALEDFEQRFGFNGARFTSTNGFFTFVFSALITAVFYFVIWLIPYDEPKSMLISGGIIPYFIVFFSCWSIAILITKNQKLKLQERALRTSVTPDDPNFVLTSATADAIKESVYKLADEPRQFILFNRIMIALASLKNLGQLADMQSILGAQAERDEASVQTSFASVTGFVWSIPVLGFIGTVVGLSVAIGGFANVLNAVSDTSQIVEALKGVTGGLGTAFETTLEGLVAALVIQLFITRQRRKEEEFLDECAEYCTRHIVGKLRILPFERTR